MSRWWRRRGDEDFADEVRAHLQNETDRLIEEGMPPHEARAAAQRAFGSITRAREQFHDSQRIVWLHQLVQDLRYAWRGLGHSRAFVATTVVTLAVGIGLVTVVFAIFSAYVLRPFAVHDPYSLYSVSWRAPEAGGGSFRWRDYEQIAARTDLFAGVIAETTKALPHHGRQLSIGFVSGNYFETLGVRIGAGRAIASSDARAAGGEPVAVLSDQTWTRLFDRDPAVVGRDLVVNGRTLTIVGVAAPEFAGMDDVPRDLWVPITMYGALVEDGDPLGPGQPRRLGILARLRTGLTPEQAQGSIALEPFATRVPDRLDPVRATLQQHATPVRLTRGGFTVLSPVFAAFGLVLVAACANASNVMLARATARHREIGIRLSIGASRGRVVRQLVTEGLLIALLAGGAGLALAAVLQRLGTFLFVAMLPPSVAARVRFVPLDFDYRVFLFALMVAGAATVLFALLPALQATRLSLTDALRGHLIGAVRTGRLRSILVTSQVAVSLVLLIAAATLVRNGAAIRATELGMAIDGVVSLRQNTDDLTLVQRTYDALVADPRVSQVVVASRNPLFGEAPKAPIRRPSGTVVASYAFVSPEYLDLLRIPLVHGRGFTAAEALAQAPVAIVSAAAARALWPGEDPLGKTLRIYIQPVEKRVVVAHEIRTLLSPHDLDAASTSITIVGVAGDVVNGFIYQGTDPAHLYLPTSPSGSRAAALMVRGRTPAPPVDAVREIVQWLRPDPTTFDVLAVDEIVALQRFPLRAASWLGSLLSTIALALSISGLYGVLVYTFGQRTQEIGIRMALGATARAVMQLVFVHSARLAAVGTILGLGLGFTVMKMLSTVIRLENVSVVDPGAFVISTALIMAATAGAACGPARRAARVDPTALWKDG